MGSSRQRPPTLELDTGRAESDAQPAPAHPPPSGPVRSGGGAWHPGPRLDSGTLQAILLAGLVATLYGNTLGNGFVWDDRLTAAASPGTLLRPSPGTYYRPVAMLTFATDRLLWGDNPAGFHLTNILCHGLTSWLLLGLCRSLGMSSGVALAASLLFAAHPLQSEAVAYISGRTDVLCALFVLLAVRVWRRARHWLDARAAASAGLLLIALLCKETAVLIPVVLLLVHPHERAPRPVLPLLAAAAWLLFFAGTGPGMRVAGVSERLGAVAAAALTYARLVVWPVDLHLERFTPVQGWTVATTVMAWAALALLGAAMVRIARGVDGGMLWLALAAATYAPVSGLVPIYPQIANQALFTPEHALYLPLLGLTPLVAGAAAGSRAARRRRTLPALLLTVLAAWGAIVVRRNADWRDEETLFRHTLAYDPPVGRVWFNLGNLRLHAGDDPAAAALYREALRRSPRDSAVHYNLAIALQRQGELRDAEMEYARVIALDPDFVAAYRAQAALLGARGEMEEARRLLLEAQRRERRD